MLSVAPHRPSISRLASQQIGTNCQVLSDLAACQVCTAGIGHTARSAKGMLETRRAQHAASAFCAFARHELLCNYTSALARCSVLLCLLYACFLPRTRFVRVVPSEQAACVQQDLPQLLAVCWKQGVPQHAASAFCAAATSFCAIHQHTCTLPSLAAPALCLLFAWDHVCPCCSIGAGSLCAAGIATAGSMLETGRATTCRLSLLCFLCFHHTWAFVIYTNTLSRRLAVLPFCLQRSRRGCRRWSRVR